MSDFTFRLPRLPHLPQYRDAQNQADEPANVKQYREELHRALQEGLIQIDGLIGPGGSLRSPLTTKGDVWGFNSADARIPVGADGDVLTADSSAALGVSYQTPSAGSGSTGSAIVMAKVFGRM